MEWPFLYLARPERFELPTARFVAEYSIQLSYGRLRSTRIILSGCRYVNRQPAGFKAVFAYFGIDVTR